MTYKILVLTEKSAIKDQILARNFEDFEFSVVEDIGRFVSLKKSIKPDLFLLDECVKSLNPESFFEVHLSDLRNSFPIILLVKDTDSLIYHPWVKYARDSIHYDEILSPFFEKRLRAYCELSTIKFRIIELEESSKNLEKRFRESSRDYEDLILNILDLRIPGLKDRALCAKEVAEYLSEKMGLTSQEKEELLFAALLHEIGKVGIPEEVLCPKEEKIVSEETRTYISHAIIGKRVLSCLKMYKGAATIVGEQYERFDGQGFPDGLRGNQMSVQSLILQAITFYEEQIRKGLRKDEILESIRSASGKSLEPYVAGYLAEYILEKDMKLNGNVLRVPVHELKPGMVIAEDLYSVNGTKILSKGSKINEHILLIMEERKNVDPIIGCVYVYK